MPLQQASVGLSAERKCYRNGSDDWAFKSSIEYHKENNKAETFVANQSLLINSGVGLIVNWERNECLFTSVTGYRDVHNTYRLGVPTLTGDRLDVEGRDGDRDINTFTQECRISSMAAGTIDYTVGALWFNNWGDDFAYGRVADIPAELLVTGTAPGFVAYPDIEGLSFMPGENFDNECTQYSDIEMQNLGLYGQPSLAYQPHLRYLRKRQRQYPQTKCCKANHKCHNW